MKNSKPVLNEERYQRIVETAVEGIITIDTDSLIDFVNPKMAQMLGYTTEMMIGTPLSAYLDEEGCRLLDYYLERRRRGVSEQFDFKMIRQDGSDLWVLVSTNPLLDKTGQYMGALAMFTDLTERREAERLLEWKADALKSINKRTSMEVVLSELMLGLEKLLPGSHCCVHLLDAKGANLCRGAAPSLPASFCESMDCLAQEDCPYSAVIRTRRPVVATDIETEPLWETYAETASKHGLYACWAAPFLDNEDNVDGLLAIYFPEPRTPNARELNILERATRVIEMAIGRRLAEERLAASEASLREANESLRLLNEKLEHRATTRTKQLADLAHEITHLEERERLRAADAIHGDLLQSLASARMRVDIVKAQLGPEAPCDELGQIQAILGQALESGHSVIRGLYPPTLHSGDLRLALQWLADQNQANGLRVEIDVPDDFEMEEGERRILLFRAAAELLVNVRLHAHVDRATVTVNSTPEGAVRLTVSDDGVGFSPSKPMGRADGGYGLFSLHERVKAFGGEVHTDCAPGRGCCVTLLIPASSSKNSGPKIR